MNITLLNNLMLVAVIQGFIFVVFVLASKKFKAQSTLFLVAMIFALSYNNLQYFFTNTNLITAYTLYKTFYLPMGVLIPPLWYFYVTIFLNPEKKIKSKDWLMFLPFLLFFTINSVYKILILMNVDIRGYIQFFDITLFIHEVSTLLFMFTVLVILTTKIIKFKKKATSFNYDKVIPATSWLLWIIIIAFINMAIYAAFIINLYYDEKQDDIHLVWLINSLLIYLFGHIGIYKFSILKERNIIRKFLLLESKPVHYPKDKSGYRADLIRIIEEEKGYLNPSFSLKTLSKDLGISQSHLSRIFKTEFDTSFTTYINSLRISNAKTFLSNSDFSNYTLVAIGLEAGFNSKTTFNTTFKKYTGKTPSEYRKAHQNT